MITADQLKDVMDRADALHHYLNIDQKKVEFEEEQLRTQAPDFWEDPKYAQEQMKKVKGIQKWLDGYKTVRLYADELQLMHDNVVRCLKDSDDARRWLAQTLLRVIHDDSSLEDAEFYCQEDGSLISRDDLLKQSSVCLEALLLGIWHFLIFNRKERDDSVWPDMFERYFEHEPQRPWDVRQGVLKPWTTVMRIAIPNTAESGSKSTKASGRPNGNPSTTTFRKPPGRTASP